MKTSSKSPPSANRPRLGVIASDAALRKRFFPSLRADELKTIETRLDDLIEGAESWCLQWSVFNKATIAPIAILSLVHQPHVTNDALLTRVKWTLWLYAMDDMMDGQRAPSSDLFETLRQCYVGGCGVGGQATEGELLRSLESIRRELAGFPNYAVILPFWASSLARVLDAMMYEFWMRRRRTSSSLLEPIPPFDEYMYFARQSTSLPSVWMTALMIEPDLQLGGAMLDLVRLSEQCAVVVRLVNDLAGLDREMEEGQVNAVTIRAHMLSAREPSSAVAAILSRATRDVRRRLRLEQRRLRQLASEVREARAIAAGFVRATDFAVDLYLNCDLRDWAKELEDFLAVHQPEAKRVK
ncbi:MAG: hypothetical protein HW416_903 [Chloroflexi bacterium]|nr:hypothetical protein [Chloroflexota bacterium]